MEPGNPSQVRTKAMDLGTSDFGTLDLGALDLGSLDLGALCIDARSGGHMGPPTAPLELLSNVSF